MKKINTVIFGATGSIGKSVLSIIKKNPDQIRLEAITCNKNLKKLCQIANLYDVKKIGFNEKRVTKIENYQLNKYEVFNDIQNFHKIISKKTDIIVFATSGLESLDLLSEVLKSGKKVGIANKECIISLGDKFNKISNKYSTEIIPLDSEHNSIFHLLKHNYGKHKSITITATGGPFINLSINDLKNVTYEQAVKHPIWSMGKKISVDSATMMNKALEIIEAKYLFNLKTNEINAIIHPQAIIHAMISYENGINTAILNKPDMKIPISSLFFDFNKVISPSFYLNLAKEEPLEFFDIDKNKYPAIRLGHEVMRYGGIMPHVFNYLNEIFVHMFIKKKISFTDIVKYNEINLEKVFAKNSNISKPKFIDIVNINNWIDNNLYLGK